MRLRFSIAVLGLATVACADTGQVQEMDGQPAQQESAAEMERMNPMIALHEQDLPVFGISPPAINARGGRGGDDAEPPPQPDLGMVAQETFAYRMGDYMYGAGSDERFQAYVEELRAVGASAATHPFISKVGVYTNNPERVVERIHSQLDAGHVGIMTESIGSAEELETLINHARLVSNGGTRAEDNLELAANYWGMSVDEYKQKADVWPLNPAGELIVWAIVESEEGVANVREIAAVEGLGVMWAGAGTLGGVYRDDPEGFEAARQAILAACDEFDVPCGYPASNPDDVEELLAEGWDVFVAQGFSENGQAAMVKGRELSGRLTTMP